MKIDEHEHIAMVADTLMLELGLDSVIILATKHSIDSNQVAGLRAYSGNVYASIGMIQEECILQRVYVEKDALDRGSN